jgi:hypothetical protein
MEDLDTSRREVADLLSGKKIPVENGQVQLMLKPGECLVFEY